MTVMVHMVMGCMAISPGVALAKDNSRFTIGQGVVYDGNPNRDADDADAIIGSRTSLSYIYDKETPNSGFDTQASVSRNQFNDSEFNSTDFSISSNYGRNTERWDFGLGGGVQYDTTRDEEVTNVGTVTESDNRLSWNVGPQIAYNITERTQLSLNTNWLERYYENDDLTDYRVIQATTSLAHGLTPRQSISASLLGRKYKSLQGATREVDSVGPYLGWNYQLNPRYTFGLSAGFLASEFTGYPTIGDGWEINPVYSAELSYNGEQNTASLGLTRSREAYPNGTEYDQTIIGLENLFTINPLWSLNTGVKYRKSEQSETTAADLDMTLEQNAALNYDMNQWGVTLSQRYSNEQLVDGTEAHRNLIRLNLSYSLGKSEERIGN